MSIPLRRTLARTALLIGVLLLIGGCSTPRPQRAPAVPETVKACKAFLLTIDLEVKTDGATDGFNPRTLYRPERLNALGMPRLAAEDGWRPISRLSSPRTKRPPTIASARWSGKTAAFTYRWTIPPSTTISAMDCSPIAPCCRSTMCSGIHTGPATMPPGSNGARWTALPSG